MTSLTTKYSPLPAKDLAPIIVIDDNKADTEFIIRMFVKNGCQNPIHAFLSGEEALDYLHKGVELRSTEGSEAAPVHNRAPSVRPKFILLDLIMPGMSGLDVLRRIRANERTASVPVVVFTGSSREESLVETYGLGVNLWVEKTFDWNRLFETVSRLGLIDGMEVDE